MKLVLFTAFFFTVCLVNYSIEQSAESADNAATASESIDSIMAPATVAVPPGPIPIRQITTTRKPYISTAVLYAVPITIVFVTLLIGFGLIAYAQMTGGNGIFFLTRTSNERLIP